RRHEDAELRGRTDRGRGPPRLGERPGGLPRPRPAHRRRADEHTREVAIERRVDAADALLERRVRGEQAGEPGPEPAREVEVAQLLRPWVLDARPRTQRADLLQRARNAVGIPGELYGRRIGQELALPRGRRLDQLAEQHADVAEDDERQPDQHGVRAASALLAPAAARAAGAA